MIRLATVLATMVALVGAGSAQAATLQEVGLFDQPMYVTSDPSDPNRLFVAEREGRIVEVSDGNVRTFADLSSVVSCCLQERGLQSIALAPGFATNGRLYAFYTGEEEPNEIRVGELRASGNEAPLGSLRDVLEIPHPGLTNHYGGQLQFGPDGLLYISTGDGGGSNDPGDNAQSLASLLGKILRIDPLPSGVLQYTVPAGNPWAGGAPEDDPIWSLGLRNPFRFSFDRLSGAMLIGDVGQAAIEEVDYAPPGGGGGVNYGWDCFEGTLPGAGPSPDCSPPFPGGYTGPVFEYDSSPSGGSNCAIVGGYVVRDRSLGDLYGRYLYGDYCATQLRSFDLADPDATDRIEGLDVAKLISFGEDSCGRLYTVAQGGRISRLVGSPANSCAAAGPPQAAQRAPSFVGIRALGRRVIKRKRAQITAFVSPCAGRRGEPVRLMRGRVHLATRRLDRACSVRFRPRITRRSDFRATIAEDEKYVGATSRKLRIKVRHAKAAQRRQAERP